VQVVIEGFIQLLLYRQVLVGLLVRPLFMDLVRPAFVFSQALSHYPTGLTPLVPDLDQVV
jgi:hypothetical protein